MAEDSDARRGYKRAAWRMPPRELDLNSIPRQTAPADPSKVEVIAGSSCEVPTGCGGFLLELQPGPEIRDVEERLSGRPASPESPR